MNVRLLHCTRALRTALLILLLGVAGMSNVLAYDFEADNLLYTIASTDPIVFADYNVKTVCVANWDTDGDGELSYAEAAAVTSLGTVFSNNTAITSFDELQYFTGLTSIGGYAFRNCTGLTSVVIPNSVTSIGGAAFYGCTGLTSLEIPNSVTSIGGGAFYGCTGLTSVEIGNSVTSIGDSAFRGCTGLNSIEIPNSVTSIGRYAFYGCTGLTSVEIPNSVTSIGSEAFRGCTGLTSVEIPNSVTSIGGWAFYGCSGLEQIVVDAGNTVYDSRNNCDAIIETATNTLIAGCKNTVIPNSVTSIGDVAFYGCTGLTSVEIPNSVTSIGNYAFRNCTGLTSVEIPNSVTSIGGYAFYGCTGLTSVEIGNSVTSIGDYAFEGCTGLTSVEIPNSVTSIGDYAFEGCTGLTSVEIGNSVTSIGIYAFHDCTGLTSVEIPNSVTSIGRFAFYGCSGLEQIVVDTGNTVYDSRNNCDAIIETATNTLIAGCKNTVIPNSVTSIGDLAFDGCTGLTSVVIPNSVTSIGVAAFSYCTGLTSVEIPNSVTSIGGSAFYGCTGLTSVEIPNSVTSIREWAFYGCTGLTSMTVHAEIPPTLGDDVFWDVNTDIPVYVACGSMEAYQNAEGWSAFTNYQCLDNTNILFADQNVKAICVANWDTNGDGELSYDEAAAVTDIGTVFGYNGSITSFDELQYFTGLTSIRDWAFPWCTGLTSVEIPNSVTFIDEGAFFWCTGLTSVEIPNSVTSIGEGAFFYCTGLTSVEIPNSVTSIGGAAFSGCSGLEQIVVDTGNTVYDSRNNCDAIIETATNTLIAGCKNTVIPNSVTSIGAFAFYGCTGLTSLEIPNSVTSIGEFTFHNCTGLTSLEIPNSVTSIGESTFHNCTGLTSVVIPNSVTSIGGAAFDGCTGLTSVEIPNSVTSIGVSAFYGCTGLTSVEIGNSVTSIGDYAFYNCYNLTSIKVNALIPPAIGDEVFYSSTCPIYVPYESLQAYLSEWSQYEDRILPFLQRSVAGYGENANGQWAFIASPLADNMEATAIENMTADDYDLYSFNQSEELEWRNHKYEPFELVNGTGYLYANTDDVELVFKGTFNEDETKETDLVYDAAADFAGWNLVGNPFPYAATVDRSHYVMNAEGTALEPTALSEGTSIAPCTGVMVKADTEGETVTFAKAMRQGTANNGLLRIAVPDGDKAIVSFNAGDRLEKFGFGNQKATISIPQGGKDYAIAYSEGKGETPLNFKAAKNGEYTLTVDMENVDLAYLHLIDNLTGADVDLLVSPEYTFTAKTTDYASRFRLVFDANGNNDSNEAFAFISNGNIVINGEGTLQIVDATGRVIRTVGLSQCGSRTTTNGMAPGVYVLRLINGNDVMTQKLVIE